MKNSGANKSSYQQRHQFLLVPKSVEPGRARIKARENNCCGVFRRLAILVL